MICYNGLVSSQNFHSYFQTIFWTISKRNTRPRNLVVK